jgi:hypothetical protein
MNPAALVQPAANAPSALLQISGLRLVVPQNEILALEATAEVDARDPGPLSVGWLQHAQQRWPVYCLAPDLSLLGAVPGERRACVLLGADGECVGVLCDDVSIEQSLGQRHAVPAAMRVAGSPLLGLIELAEGGIACVSDTRRLLAHVARAVGA